MPAYPNAEDYIADQPALRRSHLEQVHQLILDTIPAAEALPNSKVPTYCLVPGKKPDQQLMMMASAQALSFYPYQGVINQMADRLKDYQLGKGTVKFPYSEELPLELLTEMIRRRAEELAAS